MSMSIRTLTAALAATLSLLLAGCAGIDPQVYAQQRPALDLKRYFSGKIVGHGMVLDRSGQVTRRFVVDINATWAGDTGTLDEDFVWSDGEKEKRIWTLRPVPGTAMHAVVQAYGLDRDFEAGLPRCLEDQGETLVLHELGEHQAGRLLGPQWAAMRLALPTRRADLYARAVRDHLADLGLTLPTLLDRGADTAIHFWFANYDGVRLLLYPALQDAYARWVQGDGGAALRQAATAGLTHFTRLAMAALELQGRAEPLAGAAVETLLTAPSAVCPGQAPG
jgi:hypothetical protein